MTRLVVRAKDVMIILGVQETAAKAHIRKIRTHFKKENTDYINVREFAEFEKIPLDLICQVVR